MSPNISRHLRQHTNPQQPTLVQYQRTSTEFYLTWAETSADANEINTYFSTGTPGGSLHVPDWLDSKVEERQLFTGI
ncbi:hypothetical protein GGI10_003490, partial [Coemansia sp. RSA 2530]